LSNWSEALKKDTKNILGVVNITNDSFSNDGLLGHKEQLIKNLNSYNSMNIRFLDIGCVSTKPGYEEVSKTQELQRLQFFTSNYNLNFSLSIDTMNPEVAEVAMNNQFEIINDVSGLLEKNMVNVAVEKQCKVIVVHRHRHSESLHQKFHYKNITSEVREDLINQVDRLIKLGIKEDNIAVDPGLGFGKEMKDSAELLKNIEMINFGLPIIVGYSKKKFTKYLDMSSDDLFQHCLNSGIALVRLHIST
jgi:dihydropteroate synthase